MSEEWEPVVTAMVGIKDLVGIRPTTNSPLQMRKKDPKDPKGGYFYRDPTPEELQEYLEAEAW
ncbi:hypothetical protein ACRAVF_18910 [Bradyrhizobium oligotrophicum S58]